MKVALLIALCGCAVVNPVAQSAPAPAQRPQTLLELLLGSNGKPSVCPPDGLLHLEGGIDDDAATAFTKELDACKGRSVVVEINSPGGEVFAAQQVQKAIERHDKPVSCVVDGLAASAAFVTLQSCAHRYATGRSLLMAHEAKLGVQGPEQELKNGSDSLRVINWGMAAHCSKRMGITIEQFQAHVSGGHEWYLTQEDALKEHAIDDPAESVIEIVRLVGSNR